MRLEEVKMLSFEFRGGKRDGYLCIQMLFGWAYWVGVRLLCLCSESPLETNMLHFYLLCFLGKFATDGMKGTAMVSDQSLFLFFIRRVVSSFCVGFNLVDGSFVSKSIRRYYPPANSDRGG
jgi:hypothetical protein